jgi:hypothetical protein
MNAVEIAIKLALTIGGVSLCVGLIEFLTLTLIAINLYVKAKQLKLKREDARQFVDKELKCGGGRVVSGCSTWFFIFAIICFAIAGLITLIW